MSLVSILLAGFFLLGLLCGPLVIAFVTKALSKEGGRQLGNWSVGLGLKSVWRPALTFNAANELTLKRRAYDEKHDEQKISFGGMFSGVERFLFDPQDRIHDFLGTPFAFVDERFGIILDPRDAAVGRELDDAQHAGTYTRRVENGEQIDESVLSVFEVPKPNVGVRLPDVWSLVGGSFDAQLVRKVHEFYQKGQAPKSSTTALRQLLVPVGAFIAVVLLGMFAAGQTGGGSAAAAPSGNSSEITIGWLGLLAMPLFGGRNRRDSAVYGLSAVLGLGLAAMLYVVFPIWIPLFGIPLPLGVWAVIAALVGATIIPVTAAWFGRSLGGLGIVLGKLYITIGLLPYEKPVIRLVEENKYELVEYDEHEWPIEPQFYRFAMTRLGVGFANDLDVWGDDVALKPAEVDAMAEMPVAADGGTAAPKDYALTDFIKTEDIHGYVPEEVDEDALYVRTDLSTGWFYEAGQNRRLMKAALDTAKEKYGGGNKPVNDKVILAFTLVAMAMGAVFNWLVFF